MNFMCATDEDIAAVYNSEITRPTYVVADGHSYPVGELAFLEGLTAMIKRFTRKEESNGDSKPIAR
jgi:hypothetical protein